MNVTQSSKSSPPVRRLSAPNPRPKKPLPSWRQDPRRRAIRALKRRARPALNRFIARYSKVGDPVVFPKGTFEWETALLENWIEIRNEALQVLEIRDLVPAFQEVSPDQQRITQGQQWKTFWFRGFGHRSEAACSICPVTDAVLNEIPGIVTAFFSILAPNSHIVAHTGVTKGMINCHLGLVVPDDRDACTIQVGPEKFSWEPGELRIFDDTHRHEVWNDTKQDRIVLMVQFERPLRAPGSLIRNLFFKILKLTPYVKNPTSNQLAFDALLAHHLKTTRERRPVTRNSPS